MKIVPMVELRARFSFFIRMAAEGPIIVTKKGKPVAIVLAMADEDELDRLVLAYSKKFQALLAAAEERIQAGAGIHHEDFW